MNGSLEQKDGNFGNRNGDGVPTNQSASLTKVSPVLVLVMILLAAVFFVAGLLHLLLRLLSKRPSSSSSSSSPPPPALQRQLRQLFRLHDAAGGGGGGLEQALIDALPVFRYRDVVGPKQPFDCPVCLCEFSEDDELRLLPGCGHAFHARCIDAWLLSNSTCPLCRRSLSVSDVLLLADNDDDDDDDPASRDLFEERDMSRSRVFSVRLGKFKGSNVGAESGGGESSRCNLDARRCYSMGTFRYVVGESDLRVTLVAGGEGGGESEGKKISGRQKGESFSVSKIWLWSKNSRLPGCSDTDIRNPNQSSPV